MRIVNRYDKTKVIYEDDAPTMKATAENAVKKGVSLAGANFAGANFAGANFADANFAGAYFAGAYFADANFADANFAGAYFADANFAGAYFAGAYFAGAYFADAKGLPKPMPPDPVEPYVRSPKRTDAERAERFRRRHPDVPVVADLDKKILEAIKNGGGLNMSQWHTCDTTHCRAGWAVALAGEAGFKLEREVGPHRAGFLIYGVSTGRTPHFFATNEAAMKDIMECAAKSAEVAASDGQ